MSRTPATPILRTVSEHCFLLLCLLRNMEKIFEKGAFSKIIRKLRSKIVDL